MTPAPPRPAWIGSLTFGRVAIPVSLYPATRESSIAFRLLHQHDLSPIQVRRLCAAEQVEVPWEEIVRGYEYAKGQYVIVTDEDFARARPPGSLTVGLERFVIAAAIDWAQIADAYYVIPGRVAARAYAALHDALASTGRIGIGTIVLGNRERLAAITPGTGVLLLVELRFADEIRPLQELAIPEAQVTEPERALTLQLVEALSGAWHPSQYAARYRETLRAIIRSKIDGNAVVATPEPGQPEPTQDLVEALASSLGDVRKGEAKAPARRRSRRGRVA